MAKLMRLYYIMGQLKYTSFFLQMFIAYGVGWRTYRCFSFGSSKEGHGDFGQIIKHKEVQFSTIDKLRNCMAGIKQRFLKVWLYFSTHKQWLQNMDKLNFKKGSIGLASKHKMLLIL